MNYSHSILGARRVLEELLAVHDGDEEVVTHVAAAAEACESRQRYTHYM